MISKQERQKLILDIIQDNIIASQEELLAQLIKHGVETTQT
ncbi:MAG: arginine repressor, partial [Leuconostoc mesenteroides]